MIRRRFWSRVRDDSGSAPVELVIMTPLIVMLVGLALFTGRVGTTKQDVISASRDAARAAAARQFPGPATADGEAAAAQTLAARNVSCATLSVVIDTSRLTPGGSVTSTVSCVVNLADVTTLLALPGTVTIEASSTVVVDRYRGGGGG